MKDVMGLIFTGENDIHLGELTSLRAVAALPIAGRYRVIDFQLSSMVHSGIKNVGVITQKNYSSLMDHIGSGREWDLHGKQGLVMLPPFLTRENMGVYSGLLDALKSNCTYLRLSRQEYIVLTNSHTIYNMDYTDALKYHIEKGADVTVLYAHGAKAVGVYQGARRPADPLCGGVRVLQLSDRQRLHDRRHGHQLRHLPRREGRQGRGRQELHRHAGRADSGRRGDRPLHSG